MALMGLTTCWSEIRNDLPTRRCYNCPGCHLHQASWQLAVETVCSDLLDSHYDRSGSWAQVARDLSVTRECVWKMRRRLHHASLEALAQTSQSDEDAVESDATQAV